MKFFADKLKNLFGLRNSLSEEVFEDFTDLLVEGDFGASGAFKLPTGSRSLVEKKR